jgi:hypothetical protein
MNSTQNTRVGSYVAIVCIVLGFVVSLPSGASARSEGIPSLRLGQGRVGKMAWAVSAEAPNDPAETCVSIATVEPGVPRGVEGSEVTNCAEPGVFPLTEVWNSRYGVVFAGLFRPDARRLVLVMRGRPPIVQLLGHRQFQADEGVPGGKFSFGARAFRPHTCIRGVRAFDASGKAVSSFSSRQCIK